MEHKLDRVSVKLVEALVEINVEFYKTVFKDKETSKELLRMFNMSPLLSLQNALNVTYSSSDEIVRKKIVAAVNEKISIEECAAEIIKEYEEKYYDRLWEEEERNLGMQADIKADMEYERQREIVKKQPIDKEREMTALVAEIKWSQYGYTNKDKWVFKLFYSNDLSMEIGNFSEMDFDTKEDVLQYIEGLKDDSYNITHIMGV